MNTLRRELGVRDLVLMNVAAIVGLRWLSSAAQIGLSSLTLWLIGLVIFFVPIAITVLELSRRLPGAGGLYLWTRSAFGDAHGFIAGWAYWVSNLVFLPSALLFGAGVLAAAFDDPALAENRGYNLTVCLAVLWGCTLLNVVGLGRAKWLQNIGAASTWLAGVLLLAMGGYAWWRFGSATPLTAASLLPKLDSLAAFSTLAVITFAYVGLELGPILGGEIRDPARTVPRATIIATVVVALLYMAGTLALLVALPPEKIGLIAGIPQALAAVGERTGMPWFGPLTALLVGIGSVGGASAWITGSARLPFVVGVDRFLPAAMAGVHPRFGTPWVALLVQAALATIALLAAVAGATVREAYVLLTDMTLILTFVPLLYVFAAWPALRRRESGGTGNSVVVAALGIAATGMGIVTSLVPPADHPAPLWFFIKVGGGCALMILIGWVLFARARR